MRSDFSRVLETIPSSGIRRFFDLIIGAKDIISLGVGEPDFVTPLAVREEAIFSLDNGFTSYTSNRGLAACCEQIALYVKERFGGTYNPKTEIMVTVGVSEGVDIVLRSILNPGDEVVLPEPCYVCYAPLIELAGGKTVSLNTEPTNFIVTAAALAKKITPKTKAVIICSPNNPTGMVIPKEELQKIAELAKKHDFWVISDEIYAELSYDKPYTSFASLPGMKDYTILMNGFSKAFAMTGWRLGYICAPTEVVARALKIHQYSILCAPITAQYAAIEALKQAKKIVPEMRKSYEQRRNFFVRKINDIGLPTQMPSGAFYCFPLIRQTGLTSEEFALRLLEQERVAVVPGSVFGSGGEGYIRCCYATNLDLLRTALERIEKFVKKVQK